MTNNLQRILLHGVIIMLIIVTMITNSWIQSRTSTFLASLYTNLDNTVVQEHT
jgi:hypothetical protein